MRGPATASAVRQLALQAYDRMIGLQLDELSVDSCLTKTPCGGEAAGRSPADRGEQGLKRSVATEATGIPLGIVSAGPNRHDAPLLAPTLKVADEQVGGLPDQANVNLDRGYDSGKPYWLVEELGFAGEIARKGVPAPIQAGKRWVGCGAALRSAPASWTSTSTCRRDRHTAYAHPPRDPALPLGRPTHHQAPEVTPVVGCSLDSGPCPGAASPK